MSFSSVCSNTTREQAVPEPPVADPTRVVYEMAISHAEFFRTLPSALPGAPFEIHERKVLVNDGERKLEIVLSPESTRLFGPIPLPVTHVELNFDGYSAEERDRFLARFHDCYRRGGG